MTECVIGVLTTFDVFCDLLLNRPTTTWNLFVLYDKKKQNVVDGDAVYAHVLQ